MLPDFLVIGAPKAGTTSLHQVLDRHPGVFVPDNKEPCYFGLDDGEVPRFCGPGDDRYVLAVTVSHRSAYEALFAAKEPGQVAGECSTQHLFMSGAAERAARLVPSARIIAILREPASRAYSHWSMKSALGLDPLSFAAALEAEPGRLAAGWAPCWGYRAEGLYSRQLAPWLEHFGDDQVRVFLFDEVIADERAFIGSVLRFLGVDPEVDSLDHANRHVAVRSQRLQAFLRPGAFPRRVAHRLLPRRVRQRAGRALTTANQASPPVAVIDRLRASYRDEVDALEVLLDRDLTAWRH